MAVETETELETRIASDVADNTAGDVSVADIRIVLQNLVDSLAFRTAITAAAIKTLYESNASTNAFTDALQTKLNGIAAGAAADQTGAEIVMLLQALTGNAQLNASALRLIAAALDTELGSTTWRTGGGGTQAYFPIASADVGGTANAITLTTGQSLSALTGGMLFFFNSTNTNTGATTINVDGIGTRNLQRSNPRGEGVSINTGSEALTGGEITNSDPVMVVYGSQFNEFYLLPSRAGTAAYRNVGTAQYDLASLDSDGRFLLARLGSGTPGSANFLRGDGAWETPTGGGTADGVLDGVTLAVTAAGLLSGVYSRSIGADVDSNSLNLSTVLALLTGATYTGPVILHGTPTTDNEAANKAYVDALVAGITPTPAQQEAIYYGIIGSVAEAAMVDVSTLTSEDATVAGHTVSIGPSTDGNFFVFLVPADHAILTLVNTGLNVDVLSTYTRADDVRMLGTPAENYHAYTFGPLNPGLTVNYRLTLTE